MKNTHHEDAFSAYFGFLIQGNDGKNYDIGIGHDYPAEFEGIEAGNFITIPFYRQQVLDTNTGLCVVKFFHDYEAIKGSYTK